MNQIGKFTSIEQIQNQYLPKESKAVSSSSDQVTSFSDILRKQFVEEASEIKFSKHATQRLDERNISLSVEQSERLNAGVQKASEKGYVKDGEVVFYDISSSK